MNTLPQDRSLRLRVDPVDVRLDGEGAVTVLMIHGWPDTLSLWDGLVAGLGEHHRCARFTLPGFAAGDTRQPWSLDDITALIARIADAVSPQRPIVLLVHDWGALFGYHFAFSHPHRVARLVGLDIGDMGSPAHLRSLGPKQKLMIAGYQLWLAAAWRAGGALGDRMTRAMARWLRAPGEPAGISSRMNYPYDIAWFRTHGSYRHARGPALPVPMPMLYVYGQRKPFMFRSPQWLAGLAAQPGCRVAGLPSGHWLMSRRPQVLCDLLLEWLGSLRDDCPSGTADGTRDRHHRG